MPSEVPISKDEVLDETDLAYRLLTDWWLGNVRRMVGEIGSERTIELLWPHHANAALAAYQYLQGATRLEPCSGWDWTHDLGWISTLVMHIFNRKPVMEISYRERGNFTWVEDCILKNGPSELCEVMCRRGHALVAETLGQDVVSENISMLSKGDGRCSWLTYSRSRPRPDPDDLGQEMATSFPVRLPRELVDAICLEYLSESWVMSTRAMVSIDNGRTCNKTLYPLMKNRGADHVAQLRVPQRSADMAISEIERMQTSLAMTGQRGASKDGDVKGTIKECPFKDAPPETCGQIEAFCNGMCEAVDPRMHFSYLSSMAKGDKECVWEIKVDPEVKAADTSDPLRVLKLRFARGEISEEQYLRMRSLLES
jgi:predicted ArsR family transcriptional regulator